MARNKVEIVNGSTTTVLLDVSGTTATPATVLTGYTFTQADGTQATGTMEQTSGGGIQEVATEAGMDALVTSGSVGDLFVYTGTTGKYTNGQLYQLINTSSVSKINIVVEGDLSEMCSITVNGTELNKGGSFVFDAGSTLSFTGYDWEYDTVTWIYVYLSINGESSYQSTEEHVLYESIIIRSGSESGSVGNVWTVFENEES